VFHVVTLTPLQAPSVNSPVVANLHFWHTVFDVAAFDIFEGEVGREPLWRERADGVADAIETMQRMAKSKPGRYFVWESRTQQVLAMIDTMTPRKHEE
jgi:hypothetical protein